MFEELLDLYKTKATEIERQRKEVQAMIMLVAAIEQMSKEIAPSRATWNSWAG